MSESVKQLGKSQYKVHPLPAGKSTVALARFLRLIKDGGGADALLQAPEDDLLYFQKLFSESSFVSTDGGAKWLLVKDVFEMHFQQNLTEYAAWIYYCVEVNFGGFFADALAKATEAEAAKKE